MSAGKKFLEKLAIAKQTPRPDGVYKVSSGWKHSRSVSILFSSRIDAETDYRFCCDWDQ